MPECLVWEIKRAVYVLSSVTCVSRRGVTKIASTTQMILKRDKQLITIENKFNTFTRLLKYSQDPQYATTWLLNKHQAGLYLDLAPENQNTKHA